MNCQIPTNYSHGALNSFYSSELDFLWKTICIKGDVSHFIQICKVSLFSLFHPSLRGSNYIEIINYQNGLLAFITVEKENKTFNMNCIIVSTIHSVYRSKFRLNLFWFFNGFKCQSLIIFGFYAFWYTQKLWVNYLK